MGYPGVELAWKPGTDDNWVSCYEVFRDGALIDKVAHGTYYFDHSVGADPAAGDVVSHARGVRPDALRGPAPVEPWEWGP